MTKPNEGKPDTNTHKCEAAIEQRNLMTLRLFAQGISIGSGFCLTIYLGYREQYFYSLLALTLTIASATSERLKKIRIGIRGLQSEWRDPPK